MRVVYSNIYLSWQNIVKQQTKTMLKYKLIIKVTW